MKWAEIPFGSTVVLFSEVASAGVGDDAAQISGRVLPELNVASTRPFPQAGRMRP
jgi:hypothetical protein